MLCCVNSVELCIYLLFVRSLPAHHSDVHKLRNQLELWIVFFVCCLCVATAVLLPEPDLGHSNTVVIEAPFSPPSFSHHQFNIIRRTIPFFLQPLLSSSPLLFAKRARAASGRHSFPLAAVFKLWFDWSKEAVSGFCRRTNGGRRLGRHTSTWRWGHSDRRPHKKGNLTGLFEGRSCRVQFDFWAPLSRRACLLLCVAQKATSTTTAAGDKRQWRAALFLLFALLCSLALYLILVWATKVALLLCLGILLLLLLLLLTASWPLSPE